jgi:S-layer like family, N-terminal region
MKGINVRKIAAVAGIAVLGLSAFAVADVVYGSTQLVDQNGQPTVKIYVGSSAAISDGVAAANIAAKIANEAYKSSTLTASVSGTPTCTVGAGVGGGGTCSIVESSKKVTLTVTVPGTIAGTHEFKTLITDTIDRTTQNRNNSLSEDNYTTGLTTADTGGSVTSPLRGVEDGQKGTNLYKIGSGEFNAFADYNVVDNQATATSYTEQQNFWVGSQPNAVAYDSSSQVRDVDVNKYSAMAYSALFTGNDYGIPVCTGDLATNDSTNWASCDVGSNSRSDRHRVQISFLGSQWVISEMSNPANNQSSSTSVVKGGEVKLAKEAKYGIINVGQVLDAGTFKVRLSDISVQTGANNAHPAIIDVLDANDAVVGQIQVDAGTTYTFTQSGTGSSVKIHVYNTAPGFTLNAKWAEMAVYSDEITLKDGQRYNLVSSTDTDKNFKVSLLWKNRDFNGPGDSTVPDSLREIVIYNVDGFSDKTVAGDVTNFPLSTPVFSLTYKGVDLADSEYQPLTYTAESSDSYRIATASGDTACASSSSGDLSYTAKLVEIRTSGVQALGGTGDGLSGDYMFEKVLFDPVGRTGANSTSLNGTQNLSAAVGDYIPVVFWQVSGRDCYNWNTVAYHSTGSEAIGDAVKFSTAGDNSAAQGTIFFSEESGLSTGIGFNGAIVMKEDAGKFGVSSNNAVYSAVPFLTNSSYSTLRFRQSDSSTEQIYYKGLGTGSYVNYEPQLVTERGTKVLSVGTSDASFNVATRVGMPTFDFSMSNTSSASTGDDYVMGVGDSKVFGGVTVTVKAIDATAGSCSVLGPNGTPACSVDSTSLSAVIQPDNAPTATVSQPYELQSSLVATDADGSAAGVAILVGGPAVNTMTSAALQGSNVDFNVDTVVVKEIGNKIVVAGKTAADTMTAADQFIAGVKRQ